jgi:hypothetical protein
MNQIRSRERRTVCATRKLLTSFLRQEPEQAREPERRARQPSVLREPEQARVQEPERPLLAVRVPEQELGRALELGQ